jgi:hypothetical protein
MRSLFVCLWLVLPIAVTAQEKSTPRYLAVGGSIGSPAFLAVRLASQPAQVGLAVDFGRNNLMADSVKVLTTSFKIDLRYFPKPVENFFQPYGFAGVSGLYPKGKTGVLFVDAGGGLQLRLWRICFGPELGILVPTKKVEGFEGFALVANLALMVWLL